MTALAISLDPTDMSDAGMFAWAGIVTLVSLVISFFVAVWWHRRKDGKRDKRTT